MNHKLLTARVPLAWIALGLVLLTALVQILVANSYASFGLGVAEVAAGLLINPVALLIVVLLALSCRASPIPGAAKAVVISVAAVVSLFTVAAVVQAITSIELAPEQGKWWQLLAAGPLYSIVPLLLLTIVAWVLVASAGSSPAGDSTQPRAVEGDDGVNESGSEDVQSASQDSPGGEVAPPEVPSSEDQAPTWELDKASGVVWQSAAAAATGAHGSGYGMPGQARGSWQPAPALQSTQPDSTDSSASPNSAASPVSASSPVSPDSHRLDEDQPAEDQPAEDQPAEDQPAEDQPVAAVAVASGDDREVGGSDSGGDAPAAASSGTPLGRRFAAAQLPESPSSADSPARN